MSERTSDALSDALDRIEALEERIGVMAGHIDKGKGCAPGQSWNFFDCDYATGQKYCDVCWREWGLR
jgi:hypothetical protein